MSDAIKISMKLRSKNPVAMPWGEKVVHDFASMSVADKIAIDDTHGDEIGAGSVRVTEYGLELNGEIYPNEINANHASNRIAYNFKHAIPQQASLDWNGDYTAEIIEKGKTEEVNGIELTGPVTVIRDWSCRAAAICKEGMDSETSSYANFAAMPRDKRIISRFSQSNKQGVTKMTEEEKKAAGEGEITLEALKEVVDALDEKFAKMSEDLDELKKCSEEETTDAEKEEEKADAVTEMSAKLDKMLSKMDEFETRMSAFGSKGIPNTKNDKSDGKSEKEQLWAEYRKLTDAAEKTIFYRKNKAKMV